MATQTDFLVKKGLVVRNTTTFSTIDSVLTTDTNSPMGLPSLDLDFTQGILDPRVTFLRTGKGSYVGKDGLVEFSGDNTPRFDYSSTSTGTCLGLLIEPASTNYFIDSSNLYINWSMTNGSIISQQGISPTGNFDAIKLVEAITTNNKEAYQTGFTVSSGTSYTISVYAKESGRSQFRFGLSSGYFSLGTNAYFDLSNGTTNGISGGFTTSTISIIGNGWYRCSATYVPIVSGSTLAIYFTLSQGLNTNYTGDGISSILFWGPQHEQQPYPTSYIPTTNSAAIRGDDIAQLNGSNFTSWYNNAQGTIYAEFQQYTSPNLSLKGVLAISDNTSNNISSHVWINSPSLIVGEVFLNNVGSGNPALTNYVGGQVTKVSQSVNGISNTLFVNGQNAVSALTGFPKKVNTLTIGSARFLAPLTGWMRRIKYFPSMLTATQNRILTSSTMFIGNNFPNVIAASTSTVINDFIVQQGIEVSHNFEIPHVDSLYVTLLDRPISSPSLTLNFLNGILDSKISYTRSGPATYVGPSGNIQYATDNQPRFDYSVINTGTCLGLLIEENRTNLYTYSTAFENTSIWSSPPGSIIQPGYVGPDGQTSAYKIKETPVSGNFGITRLSSFNFTTSTVYTLSVYVKAVENRYAYMWWDQASGDGATMEIDLFTGATRVTRAFGANYSNVTYSVENKGNGWYRGIIRASTSNNVIQLRMYMSNTPWVSGNFGTPTYTGIAGNGILIWGAQLEQGAFPTSYIPSGSSVITRGADTASIVGNNFNNWYNPNEGTLYVEADITADAIAMDSYRWPVAIKNINGGKTLIGFYKMPNSMSLRNKANTMPNPVGASSVLFETELGTITTGTYFKSAIAVSSGDSAAIMNTNPITTSTGLYIPSPYANILTIGLGDIHWIGHIRKIIYYPIRLSNTELQTLTV